MRRFSGFLKFGWLVKKYGLPTPAQLYVGCSRYNFEMYRKTGRQIFLAALFGNPTGFTDDEIELKILPDALLKKVLPRAGGVLRKQIEARLENK